MVVFKKACSLILIITALCFGGVAPCFAQAAARLDKDEIMSAAQGIVAWKKASCGVGKGGSLLDAGLAGNAGTAAGDWYALGVARLGIVEEHTGYRKALEAAAADLYQNGGLNNVRATDIHRISLALSALGGDPSKTGRGKTIDLIADFTYGSSIDTLKRQGVGGLIWGLIALDSLRPDIPDGSPLSRHDFIAEILMQQRGDGGFALSGAYSDPDMTAMAIQALAPYRNSERSYSYTRAADKKTVNKTVNGVVEEALSRLSSLQLDGGDYASWGAPSAESTAQVIIALCCLGIDPQTDSRFIKNGNTLVDGLMLYRTSGGGFSHTLPAVSPNSVAGEQVLCALAALWRRMNGLRGLYDMRAEQSQSLRDTISALTLKIDAITDKTGKAALDGLLSEYSSIPQSESMYIYNYQKLSGALKKADASFTRSGALPSDAGGAASENSGQAEDGPAQSAASGAQPGTDKEKSPSESQKESGGTGRPALWIGIAALAAVVLTLPAKALCRRRKNSKSGGAPSAGGGDGP